MQSNRSSRAAVAHADRRVADCALVCAQGQGQPAQPTMVELAGSWAMSNEEEMLIRIDPGPELGNFTGFPAQRRRAAEGALLELDDPGGARASGAAASGAVPRCAGPGPNFHMGEIIDPVSRRLIAYTITGLFENANRTIWLDGRPHPVGVRRASLERVLHRRVGERDAQGDDDAHEAGVPAAQRHSEQPVRGDDRVSSSATATC